MYPVHRTPEQGHTRRCLANAMICAIENERDVDSQRGEGPEFESGLDLDFRVSMQNNSALTLADYYLREGIVECKCPPVSTDVDRVTGQPATIYTPPEDRVPRFADRFTDEEWAARQANIEAALDDEYSHGMPDQPTAGEGC